MFPIDTRLRREARPVFVVVSEEILREYDTAH